MSQETEASEDALGGASTEVKKSQVKKSEALWLMTFSDLSFVLLCFFVLLLSFSKTDTAKFDNVKSGISKHKKQEENLEAVADRIQKVVKKKKIENQAQIKLDADGLMIEFKDGMLFSSGSAKDNPRFRKVVSQVMKAIAKTPDKYKIVFEGHTDNVPMRGGRYKSNWELSAARGFTLLDQFKRNGVDERRMSVVAFAHTRPKVEYAKLKGRRLKAAQRANRRVVIRIF